MPKSLCIEFALIMKALFIQTSLRKGSLMLDYIIKEIEDKLDEASYQINQFLDKVFLKRKEFCY